MYDENKNKAMAPDMKRIAGIDLGMSNIITMVNNIGEQPIAVKDDGRGIKSINQFYLKEKSRLQSIYSERKIVHSRQVDRLNWKHKKKVLDYIHKASRFLINWCIEHQVGQIIVGRNKRWKQFADMGRRNNQTFVSIPYFILINQLKYKGAEKGIMVDDPEESYTSKCSFLDSESIKHHEDYLGRRTKRGLFVSAAGIKINADCNGGYNIVRKSEPKAFLKVDGVGGCGLHPKIFSIS